MSLKMHLNSYKPSLQISLSILSLLLLSGCGSGENPKTPSKVTLQDYAEGVCDAVSTKNYGLVLTNLRAIKSDPEAKDLNSYGRVEELINEVLTLKDGSSQYTAGLRFFCEDLKTYKHLEDFPPYNKTLKTQQQEANRPASTNSNSPSSSTNAITVAPSDYLAPLNKMYPHWARDISGPLTGSRSDFGIIDVLFNVNSRCSLWIFSSFKDFERFNQVWGNSFQFNYPTYDRFENIYATENSIYSTTCAMEYSNVFG